tara:strand:+ start:224 stop:559 length:336 start_codon:yes stop_codon:yes gene_type:complete
MAAGKFGLLNLKNTIIMSNKNVRRSNGFGKTGFILALVAFFFGWFPVLGWIICSLGLIFSAIGLAVKGKPKGLSTAGLVISIVTIILNIISPYFIIIVLGVFVGLFENLIK